MIELFRSRSISKPGTVRGWPELENIPNGHQTRRMIYYNYVKHRGQSQESKAAMDSSNHGYRSVLKLTEIASFACSWLEQSDEVT